MDSSYQQYVNGVSLDFQLDANSNVNPEEIALVIEKCENMQYLILKNVKIGVQLAQAISQALQRNGAQLKSVQLNGTFKRFSKTEIPISLKHISLGLSLSQAHLTELDISDNSIDTSIGIQSLVCLLCSSTCYTLNTLKLNYNSLNSFSGKKIAQALLDCHANNMKETTRPLELKVFEAGKNYLDDESAIALAKVFKTVKSLEELSLPKNKIGDLGMLAIIDSLSVNPGIRVLDFNNNNLSFESIQALAKIIPYFLHLQILTLSGNKLTSKGEDLISQALGMCK
ncbi:hypothetical protein TKK_0018765 [Trichogramma kaykai]|uniref:NLRC3 n=1 Tax=Trichogramma kaykai TaxID=54128 RepID=A0ABD2VWG6_9HYME